MTAEDKNKINRRFERANQLIMVNFKVVDFDLVLGDFDEGLTASSVDISAGGMMLRMTEKFEPGTMMDLKFKLTVDSSEIIVLAKVVKSVPAEYEGMYYVSVDYPMISDADRATIDRYVKEINNRRAQN
ncbi:MAG: PilZ domain-containing protein [Candidatus Omnitrophica bacterium]|jgi:c-di-GMP-binding flagellar brake protein YcgR|nr:PilZ domain-containing protein [Candidatus Omnitrophota bacterium]